MAKYQQSMIQMVPKPSVVPWLPKGGSIPGKPMQGDGYFVNSSSQRYYVDHPLQQLESNHRDQPYKPLSLIGTQSVPWSTDDRIVEPKAKETSGLQICTKKWQMIAMGTMIVLLCTAVGLSIYAVVASKAILTMTTTTAVPTTATTTTTTTTTSAVLPAQCWGYSFLNDPTRLATAVGGAGSDYSLFSTTYTWYRFFGSGGTQIVTTIPSVNKCGTVCTGWYADTMPSYGTTVSGSVCYVTALTNLCGYTNQILVTNCGEYYVYGLIRPPTVSLRYCTV